METTGGAAPAGFLSGHPEWMDAILGHTALVESGDIEATGTVVTATVDEVIVECDDECWIAGQMPAATASTFAPDALYRISGAAAAKGRSLTWDGSARIERIQRRRWPRKRMDLPVTLCPVEGGSIEGVPGRTVDVGVGGVCVETLRPVEAHDEAMIIVRLPDGSTVVSGAAMVAVEDLGDGWRYRLAFRNLEDGDAARLAALTSS